MAKYKFIKHDHFLQGLPACDLDDKDLTDEQRAILDGAVLQGIYEPVGSAQPKIKAVKKGDNYDAVPGSPDET